MGDGAVDHAATLRALERQGFTGFLCVEHCRSLAELEAALTHLRGIHPFESCARAHADGGA